MGKVQMVLKSKHPIKKAVATVFDEEDSDEDEENEKDGQTEATEALTPKKLCGDEPSPEKNEAVSEPEVGYVKGFGNRLKKKDKVGDEPESALASSAKSDVTV